MTSITVNMNREGTLPSVPITMNITVTPGGARTLIQLAQIEALVEDVAEDMPWRDELKVALTLVHEAKHDCLKVKRKKKSRDDGGKSNR